MAPVESPIPKFTLDPEIPLDPASPLNLESPLDPRKSEDKEMIVSSVILGVVGSSVEKAEKKSRRKPKQQKGRKDRTFSPIVRTNDKSRQVEFKARKEAEEKGSKEINNAPNGGTSPLKKESHQWKFLTKKEDGSHFFNAESKTLIEASEKWNEKIEEEFKTKKKILLDVTDEDLEVEDIMTESGGDIVGKTETEPMFTPHSTPVNGDLLIDQMKFEHAADNKFKPFDYQSMYSKGRFGEVGNNPIDWFKKATPCQVNKNLKILTPENLEDNGQPSTIFKSFDTIDLHELKKESEVFDYEKVYNSNEVYSDNKDYDIHQGYNANEAYQNHRNGLTTTSFDLIDLMSEVRKDLVVRKVYSDNKVCDTHKVYNANGVYKDENDFSWFYDAKEDDIISVL